MAGTFETSDEQKTRELNDAFRMTLGADGSGKVLLAPGVWIMPREEQRRLLETIRTFSSDHQTMHNFGWNNFGMVQQDGTRFYWRITYHDRQSDAVTRQGADSEKIYRVMTIMRAIEF